MERAEQILANYIKEKGLRKTPERFAILEKIGNYNGHFTVDELYAYMHEKNFPVSRSTLYNAVELFLQCRLVRRLTFDSNVSYYERTFDNEPYIHQICSVCGKISKHRNRDLTKQVKHVGFRGFKVDTYQLNLYGVCRKCQREANKKEK